MLSVGEIVIMTLTTEIITTIMLIMMTMVKMMMIIFTREHDVGDHPNAPEVCVQRQGLVVYHLGYQMLFWLS